MLVGAWGTTWYVGDCDTSVHLSIDGCLSLLFLNSNNIACACGLQPLGVLRSFTTNVHVYPLIPSLCAGLVYLGHTYPDCML